MKIRIMIVRGESSTPQEFDLHTLYRFLKLTAGNYRNSVYVRCKDGIEYMLVTDEEAKPLLDRIKTALGDKVLDVKLTDRLKNAAACLTGDEGMSVEMYKVLRQMPNGANLPMTFHLELNPAHPVYAKLEGLDDDTLKEYAELLLAQAQLVAGLPLDDPAAFAEQMCKLM